MMVQGGKNMDESENVCLELIFKKWAIPGLFFLYFRLFNTQLTVNKCSI